MENAKITYQYADIGHWLARCNHQTKVIELNAREFDRLSPLMKDYVWIHECVHLMTGTRDEEECNRMTDEIFVSRARDSRDRQQRMDFMSAGNDKSFTRTARSSDSRMLMLSLVIIIIVLLITKK